MPSLCALLWAGNLLLFSAASKLMLGNMLSHDNLIVASNLSNFLVSVVSYSNLRKLVMLLEEPLWKVLGTKRYKDNCSSNVGHKRAS